MTAQSNQINVIGIGDAMVDLFTRASQLPPRGGNIWSTAVEIHSGGTTANVASSLAKLGIPSSFAGFVGDDPYGLYLIDEFKRIGVDPKQIHVKKGTFTGIILAIIDDTGERTFIACARGAAHVNFTKEYADSLVFEKGEIIHSSGVCLVEEPARSGITAALEKAHRQGNRIYFDPNLRLEGKYFPRELNQAILKCITLSDVILIGDEEVTLLYPHASLLDGVHQLLALGPELVIVKQGEKGASVFSNDIEAISPAFKTEVVSCAGAGDAFDAGFIAAQFRGASIQDAMIYANAVAAIKVSRQGSQSVPSHEEVNKFLANSGIKLCLTE